MKVYIIPFLVITVLLISGMNQFKGHRTIYVFTSGQDNDHLYQEAILDLKEHGKEIAERDLVVYTDLPGGGEVTNGETLASEDIAELRKQYKVTKGEFTLILVGKDRTEKLRWANELHSLQRVFDLIDTMPMRRREMREQSGDDGK